LFNADLVLVILCTTAHPSGQSTSTESPPVIWLEEIAGKKYRQPNPGP